MTFFSDPEGLAVFACEDVFYGGAVILYVCHSLDNLWIFQCGEEHQDDDAVFLSLQQILDFDRSIMELADLPAGKQAKRPSRGAPWDIY
ncbi:MAG: hypothetical protein FWH28_00810 [Clostridiales bacterium]|nr:hypothetical protein [Clostridiales bacterium]